MNKYLKAASDRFTKLKTETFLISPISKTDAEVILEIIEYGKKKGLSEFVSILESYKFHKDEEVRDSLLDLNTKEGRNSLKRNTEVLDENGEEIEGEEFVREDWIILNKKRLLLRFIFSYEPDEEFDTYGNLIHCITINKVDNEDKRASHYSNLVIKYKNEDSRDKAVQFIDEVISRNDNILTYDE